MSFLKEIFDIYVDFSKPHWVREREKEKMAHEKQLLEQMYKYRLTCRRCGRLADPILGTSNRYRCQCGNQFTAAKHPYFHF